MFVLKLPITNEKITALESQAQARGFDNIEAYILSLIEDDQAEDIDHTPEEVAVRLTQAWHELKSGQFLTEDDYRKAMAEDD
ncbi:MAG: hypothetical protein MUF38_06810 [Anaerolineae bacterium]|jgi:hypothetical protein|nr:hypothetical protein [Anaerolineae bacterium]